MAGNGADDTEVDVGTLSVEGGELTEVTPETVRTALGDNDALAESTITLALKMARSDVATAADARVTQQESLVAILKVAAYYAFDSAPATVQKEAADASRRWNTDQFADRLKERAEGALETIGRSDAPRLHTLGGRSHTTNGRPRRGRFGRRF